MNNLQIELLADCPKHIEQLAQWRQNEWSSYNLKLTREYTLMSMRMHCNYDKLPIAFVCKTRKKPIGMVCLRQCDLETHSYLTPWLGSLYVEPKFRGHDVGKKLIIRAETHALLLNYKAIYLFMFNLGLKEWYAKQGYDLKEETIYNNTHPIIIMKKNIYRE